MRRPAVCSRTTSALSYFDEDSFEWFDSGDEHALAEAIRALHDDPQRRADLVAHAALRAAPYRWVHQRQIYVDVVQGLLWEPLAPVARDRRDRSRHVHAGG